MSKKLKILTFVSIGILMLVFTATLISNNNIKQLEDMRNKSLEGYEATKQWAMDDIRDYLSINSEENFKEVSSRLHFSKELKQELLGMGYNAAIHQGYSDVAFVDAQYSLSEEDGSFIVYLLTNVTKSGETRELEFMVFINNNQIYDIIAF